MPNERILYSDTAEEIIEKIATAAGITVEEIKGECLSDKYVVPRHLCCYFLRTICKDKYNDTQLSEFLNVSRTSIIISFNKINKIITSKQNIRKKYKDILDKIMPTEENAIKNKLNKSVHLSYVLCKLQEKCSDEMAQILGNDPGAFYQKASVSTIKSLITKFRHYISNTYPSVTDADIEKIYTKLSSETLKL
jgi:hypothetical protein